MFGGVIKSIGSCMPEVFFNIRTLIKHDSDSGYFKVKGNGTSGQNSPGFLLKGHSAVS